MIHNLYLTSIAQRKRLDPDSKTVLEISLGEQSKHSPTAIEAAISSIDNHRPFLGGSDRRSSVCSLSTDFKWMSYTVFKSCQLMHIQVWCDCTLCPFNNHEHDTP